ncbi:hypothetical protein QYE76_035143 [Lolium multiflorum]|uniref:Uncharacterized protein n=1 Tax=Lolium multiflorum TaxID=4521 RepID=A0AAD8QT45_LOLMU|nr:hypothetical protein QYE76_030915 [Lolium multiflorum]KAK1611470.1 hypothetical protein QYE76_035143 [Lolium multiflorum]
MGAASGGRRCYVRLSALLLAAAGVAAKLGADGTVKPGYGSLERRPTLLHAALGAAACDGRRCCKARRRRHGEARIWVAASGARRCYVRRSALLLAAAGVAAKPGVDGTAKPGYGFLRAAPDDATKARRRCYLASALVLTAIVGKGRPGYCKGSGDLLRHR